MYLEDIMCTKLSALEYLSVARENVGNFHHALSFDDRHAILAKKKMAVSRKISTKTVTLYTLTLVFIFSTLISPHFLWD